MSDANPVAPGSAAPAPPDGARFEALLVLGVGLVLLAIAMWRARLGVSFYDDSHYVAVSLRLANGARPLADEMSVQSLGFLVPAAFVWAWTHTVGMTALVLAYRLFYLVLAAGTGAVVYRALRRSFRPAVAGLAALTPLVCTPFNLLAPSYDTLAMLGLAIAFSMSFRALRDRHRVAPLLAGAAMAFASVSYPPLVLASAALLVTVAWMSRDRRLVALTLTGALATAVLMLAPVALIVNAAEAHRALGYASANVHGFASPLAKLGFAAWTLLLALVVPGLAPMWLLVVAASLPPARLPRAARAAVLLALPIAAAVPGLLWAASSSRRALFGNTAASWLITFAIALAVPVALWVRRTPHAEVGRLMRLATPAAVVGYTVVAYSTDASLVRAVPVVGFIPLGIAALVAYASMAEELLGEMGVLAASALVLVSVVAMLFATSVDDRRPLTLTSGLKSGPYRYMRMSAPRKAELVDVARAGARWVKPGMRVTFLGERNGYLLVGGQPYTNAVWLYIGSSDQAALDYFARHGGMPDVVFADRMSLVKALLPSYQAAAPNDPFVRRLLTQYQLAETVDDFDVFVRR